MRAGTPLLVLALLAPALAAAIPAGPSWDHPPDARAHLTPPNPFVQSWPSYARQGEVLPPPSPAQTTGTAKVLVLLVEFLDVSHDPTRDGPHFNRVFNDASAGARSMRAYYTEVSYGSLTIQATVVSTWFSSSREMRYYGNDSTTGVDDGTGPIYRLVTETVQLADPTVDFAPFDADADGVVDHVVVVHAGSGQEETADPNDIWSHRWAVLDANPTVPGSQPLTVDNVQVYGYIMVSEFSPIGVMTHEFGHDLGLPDLYDTDRSSEGAGLWDLMAGGSWNGFPPGSSPAHLSAWSRMRLGWITPTGVTSALVGTSIPAVETSGRVYRLGISGTLGREYFLVENRQPIGFDGGLPGSGLLIWHVDDGRVDNDDDARRLVDLEEADEGATGDRPTDPEDAWRSSAAGWGPETTPGSRAYSGTATGWRVRDISGSGDPMTATIARDVQRDVTITEIRLPLQVVAGSTVTAQVVVRNDGATTESGNLTVRAYRGRFDPASIVEERTLAVGPLTMQTSASFDVTFPTADVGRYLVHAAIPIAGDEIPTNNERIVHTLSNRFPFRDDVEAGSASWSLDGNPNDPHRWRIVVDSDEDGSSHSPSHAWRFGYVPTLLPNLFPPVWHTLTSPAVPVTGPPVHLVFYQRYDLSGRAIDTIPINVSETDRARVEVSLNGGPWTLLEEYTGRDLAWRAVSLNLTSMVAGPASIRVRFNASADVMPDSGGWWLDDVALAEVGLGHAVVLFGNPGPHPGAAGRTVRFDLKIANVGDFEDAFGFATNPPEAGWRVRVEADGGVVDLEGHTVRLAPDQDAALRILVDVPAAAQSGRTYTGLITARSQGDALATSGFSFTITVGESSFLTTPTFWIVTGAAGVAAFGIAVAAVAARRRRRRHPPI